MYAQMPSGSCFLISNFALLPHAEKTFRIISVFPKFNLKEQSFPLPKIRMAVSLIL